MSINKDEVRRLKYERSYFVRRTPYFAVAVAFVLAVSWSSAQPTPTAGTIRGFSVAGSAAEAARERELKAMPSAKANEVDFDVMTSEPHHTGSPYEIKLADYV